MFLVWYKDYEKPFKKRTCKVTVFKQPVRSNHSKASVIDANLRRHNAVIHFFPSVIEEFYGERKSLEASVYTDEEKR